MNVKYAPFCGVKIYTTLEHYELYESDHNLFAHSSYDTNRQQWEQQKFCNLLKHFWL